jgi:hypothetical protein
LPGFGLPADIGNTGYARFASSGDSYIGDLLKISGKNGECTYGAQNTEIELPHKFAVLIGLAQVGYIMWTDGKPEPSAFDYLASDTFDLEKLRDSIPTDPATWAFDAKGNRVDPRKLSVKIPVVDLKTGKLFTIPSSALSHVRAWKRCIRNCLLVQRANQATTLGHVPLVEVNTKPVAAQSGTSEIHILLLEVMDWVKESIVLSALGKTGSAIQFGIDNQEALNADLPEEKLEQPKAKRKSPRL